MKNELIFLIHILFDVSFLILALRLGKLALVMFYVTQVLFANFFVLKQITLFSLHVTASDVFAIGAFLSINLIREYFESALAKKTIWYGFIFVLGFMLFSQIHLWYVPNEFDATHSSYQTILSPTFRIATASLVSFLVVQKFDLWFFSVLKKKTKGRFLSSRMFASLGISQLFDTILFSFLGLYGYVHDIVPIIVMSYLIKLLISALTSPFSILSKKLVKDYASL